MERQTHIAAALLTGQGACRTLTGPFAGRCPIAAPAPKPPRFALFRAAESRDFEQSGVMSQGMPTETEMTGAVAAVGAGMLDGTTAASPVVTGKFDCDMIFSNGNFVVYPEGIQSQ